jgi:hypothetical protein
VKAAGICQDCRQPTARSYEQYSYAAVGEPATILRFELCAKCARQQRLCQPAAQPVPPNSLTRTELIATIDRFWSESGAGEICRRCHAQGTGCCPPMCRYLGAEGCLQKNIFCTGFVCSALLNAIAECNAETARRLKWIKTQVGAAEFRLYEMVTRVPAVDREPTRPLALPTHYPGPLLLDGAAVRAPLQTLQEEVLEIRRRWHGEEIGQLQDTNPSENQCPK